MSLDQHGQPSDLRWNAKHRYDRAINELLGLIRGVLSDGIVTDEEIAAVSRFGLQHPDLLERFPGNVLYQRIVASLSDGRIDEIERQDLVELFQATTGRRDSRETVDLESAELPLTDPPPVLSFDGACCVVTGKFLYGPRKAVVDVISQRGGHCEDTVTQRTRYLVIGSYASRDWKHSSFGRKIERATELRDQGQRIAIVGEDHWVSQIRGA